MYQVPLEMICRHDRTAEVCRAAVEEDGWQLENVPEELKTPELCRKALETEAGFGNDFHRGLVQHIPSPEVCMEVLKECRENNPEELYGVAVAIRPEVMNGEMADFLLSLDGRCISILPVHLQTPERVRVAVENVGDVRRRSWRSAEKPAHARCVCQVRRPQPGVADDDPVGGTLAGGLPDGEDTVPGLGEEPPGVRAGERA